MRREGIPRMRKRRERKREEIKYSLKVRSKMQGHNNIIM